MYVANVALEHYAATGDVVIIVIIKIKKKKNQ